jgi:hypothetical protein
LGKKAAKKKQQKNIVDLKSTQKIEHLKIFAE